MYQHPHGRTAGGTNLYYRISTADLGCIRGITAKWGESPTGRRARYYTITKSGRAKLGQEIENFDSVLLAINRILGRA
jgi:hypothetical protein